MTDELVISGLEVSIGVLEGKAGRGLYRWAHDSLSGRGASPAPAITSDTGGEGELQCVGPQARIHATPPARRGPITSGACRPPQEGHHRADVAAAQNAAVRRGRGTGSETRSGPDCASEPGAGVPDRASRGRPLACEWGHRFARSALVRTREPAQ